ncbi:MAG: AAA family ATPase [Rickettsiales bacterium]|nr:AAA family ATPase [Rickettsiales bacterium]
MISWKDANLIKIITGVQRAGKSTLFKLYQDYLKSAGISPAQIINLNMEDPENRKLLKWEKLFDYINARLTANKKKLCVYR